MAGSRAFNTAPVVIRLSPMAHFAVGFLTLGLLVPVLVWSVTAPLLVIPVLLSVAIERLRTVADTKSVTVRTLLSSRTVDWSDVKGLRFERGSWARAQLASGDPQPLSRRASCCPSSRGSGGHSSSGS